MLTILLLAAGASSRMRGGDKLLERVNDQPLLHHLAQQALQVTPSVYVTLPPDRPLRRAALQDVPVTCVEVADADHGMAHSLRAGIKALPQTTSAVMILPADMPELTAEDFHPFRAAHIANPERIFRGASATGKAGHPVLFPRRFFEDLIALSGDSGARDVLKKNHALVETIALPEDHALTDLDTPEQWDLWRKSQPTRGVENP